MSRIVLAITIGTLSTFITGYTAYSISNRGTEDVVAPSTIVVPAGTEVYAKITSVTPIKGVLMEDLNAGGTTVIAKGTEVTLGNWFSVVPEAAAANPTLVAGGILIGAIVGNQMNMRRPEVGAIMGGISGMATAAEAAERTPEIGNEVLLSLNHDLSVPGRSSFAPLAAAAVRL